MRLPTRTEYQLGVGLLAVVAAILTPVWLSHAQPINQATAKPAAPVNSLPNPYRSVENWARMPEGRTWGASAGVYVDPTGTSVWVAERCGANSCVGSDLPPILHFDMSGRLLKAFGAGMFVFPHGIFVDQDQNVWVTDGQGKDGKGHQVFKFSPEGKVLLTLGKAGVAGDGPDEFNAPSAVLVAPNGDIFVGDGHGGNTNSRIVKFNRDGKFIKTWGMKGSAPGDIDIPHTLAMDSRGRSVSRRPAEQPHPDFRPERDLPRSVVPVQPAERRLHRQERHHLCGGFRIRIGVQEPRRLEARHQGRPGERWRGDGVHPRPGREGDRNQRGRRGGGGSGRQHLWCRGRAQAVDEVREELNRRMG